MIFRPNPGESIEINQRSLTFCPDPDASEKAYLRSGARSRVYQLQDSRGALHALKVFTLAYRAPWVAQQAKGIAQYADIPGLSICRRTVITPVSHPELVIKHPEMRYAILMPWVEGDTWRTLKSSQVLSSIERAGNCAVGLAGVLLELEKHGLAHCNLNPDHVVFNFQKNAGVQVEMVGVENLFGPGMLAPETMVIDDPVYVHPHSSGPAWGVDADLYAGALLVGEILGFGAEDANRDRSEQDRWPEKRYLESSYWGKGICERYEQAVHSRTPASCPSFIEWKEALAGFTRQAVLPTPSGQAIAAAVEQEGLEKASTEAGERVGEKEAKEAALPEARSDSSARAGVVLFFGTAVIILGFWFSSIIGNIREMAAARAALNEQRTATAAAEGTRMAYQAATETAAPTATAIAAELLVSNLKESNNLITRMAKRRLEHKDDDFVEVYFVEENIDNFIVEAVIENPYNSEFHAWDYGFLFRKFGTNDEYRLEIASSKYWSLINRVGDTSTEIATGFVDNLFTGDGEVNQVRLAALGARGYLFINGEFIAELDLSKRTRGDIYLATGLTDGDEVDGKTTRFQEVSLWAAESFEPARTPTP